MALALYAVTALALLWLASRFITPISRRDTILLFLLPMVFTGRALLTGGVYAPVDLPYLSEPLAFMREPLGVPRPHNTAFSDLYAQMIPWRKAVQFALAHRQWPIWNPFILSGTVLAAAAQPAAYSPFTLLACLLPVATSLTFSAAIIFFVAGIGAYLFARELGCRDIVALFAAVGWMYSQALAFFILWAVGGAWAFFPLVLLGTRRCVRAPGVRSAAILTVALTLLLLAGHPETALHAVAAGAVYALFEMISVRSVVRPLLAALAAGAVAFLVCAIYILPILEAAPQTMEHAFRAGAWRVMPHGVDDAEAKARLLIDAFPFLHGRRAGTPPETAAVGSIVLAAALYAVARIRSRETWFFFALAIFGMAAGSGWMPLATALQKLPLFDLVLNERFAFAAAFALVVLASLGVERALATSDRAFGWTLALATVAVAAGAVVLDDHRSAPQWGAYAAFGEIAGIGVAAIVAALRPRALAPLMLVVLVAQRAVSAGDIYPTLPRSVAYPPIPILEPLRGIREPFRITGRKYAFVPGTSALYELEDVRGYEAMTLQRYAATYDAWCVHQPVWFNRTDDLDRPMLDLLNVRFAIALDRLVPPPWWRTVARQRGTKLLENTRVLPRAFVPDAVVLGASEIDALRELPRAADFRRRAWIEAPIAKHERDNRVGAVSNIRRSGNGVRFDADMRADGWVVVSETAWEGWRATIDGRRVKHYPADATLVALFVPAGRHDVQMEFLPRSFVVGRTVTFVTLGVLLITIVVTRLRY
jgi:hypothetical protein